ncbi:MAG: ATP-binding protein [Alistipes sp.]|nr:ATP-binding protein [Candidatus Alistipes equi]
MQERKPTLINKAFNQYLWASILTVAATQIANIVDATIVGNLIGDDGLAAVNLSKPLLQAFFATTCLYVASSTMLAGMAIGKGNRETADKLFSFSMAFSLVIGLIYTLSGLIWFQDLSLAMCQSESLRPLSDSFMRITLCSAPLQMIMQCVHQYVTMDGAPKMVSRAVIVGNIFNIMLDVVFIKYCNWGIAGAATATCVMYVISILMVLPHFRKKNSIRLCNFTLGEIKLGKVFSIGLPLFFSTVLISVQYIGNNYVAGHYLGDSGLVALAVCMQLFAFSMIILTGTLRTIQPVGSILKGMDDSQGMLMLMKRAYLFMAFCFSVYAALIIFFPTQIASLLGVSTTSGLDAVRDALPLFSLHIVFQGLLCNLLPVFMFYERKGLAMLLSVTQTLLPMVFFYLMHAHWIGFFVGQLVTGLAILLWETILRFKNRQLCRFFLIPMKNDTHVLEITILANTHSLSESILSLCSFLRSNSMTEHTVNQTALCVEELVNNIINHGHASSIDLAVNITEDSVCVSLHDDGKAFNPVAVIEYSKNNIGIGLTIVKAYCNNLSYRYLLNQNMVTFKIQV